MLRKIVIIHISLLLFSCISQDYFGQEYIIEDASAFDPSITSVSSFDIKPLNYKEKVINTTGRISIEVEYNGDLEITGKSYRKDEGYYFDNKYIRMEKTGNKYTFHVSFQSPGSYDFSVISPNRDTEGSYFLLLTYEIKVTKESPQPILKYRWDEEVCLSYGLAKDSFSHQFEVVNNKDGIETFRFTTTKDLIEEGKKLSFILEEKDYYYVENNTVINVNSKEEADAIENVNFLYSKVDKNRINVQTDNNTYTVHVSFSEADSYLLKIYGEREGHDKELLTTYIINARKGISLNDFLKQYPEAMILDKELFYNLGISIHDVTPKKAIIQTKDTLTVSFTANKKADIIPEYYCGAPWEYRIAKSVNEGNHSYTISCPSAGKYKLKIKGRRSTGEEYKDLLEYTIKATKAMPVKDFEAKYNITGNKYSDKTKKVKMKTVELDVVAYFKKEHEKMATFYMNKMTAYLPALEEYIGHDIYTGYSDLDKDDNHVGLILNENEETAYWAWTITLAKKHIKHHLPAVLFHECGHFYNPTDAVWFFEGTASFYPVAIIEYGLLDKATGSYNSHFSTWGFTQTGTKHDGPLATEDVMAKNFHFFYTKAFKIQYLIYKELGQKNYRKLMHEMYVYEYNFDFDDLNNDILHLLEKYKKINWKYFLQGWVFDGNYTKFSYEDFKDLNNNGKPDIVDYYNKNPEGTKIGFGFN